MIASIITFIKAIINSIILVAVIIIIIKTFHVY